MLGNRVLLSWEEPSYAINYLKTKVSWTNWILSFGKIVGKFALGGLMLGTIIVLAALVRNGYHKVEIISFILFFVACGGVLGLVFGFMSVLSLSVSPTVFLREKDILIISVSDNTNIPYKNIQSCSINKKN